MLKLNNFLINFKKSKIYCLKIDIPLNQHFNPSKNISINPVSYLFLVNPNFWYKSCY